MPLLTTTQKISAAIAQDAAAFANHIASAAVLANRMVSHAIAAPDADLTAWLRSQSPQEVGELFGAHEAAGKAVNAAADVAQAILAASGMAADIPRVDVRPVSEKLAGQRRRMIVDQEGMAVVTDPAPEPEPVIDEPPTEEPIA